MFRILDLICAKNHGVFERIMWSSYPRYPVLCRYVSGALLNHANGQPEKEGQLTVNYVVQAISHQRQEWHTVPLLFNA